MLSHRLVGRDHRSPCSRPPRVSVPTGMLEIIINKLPGGDASRTQPLARITLTNTGAGTGGVRIYDARITHAEERVRGELAADSCSVYRDEQEQVLRLAHRALARLLGEPAASQ